jgi:hypothetical protein
VIFKADAVGHHQVGGGAGDGTFIDGKQRTGGCGRADQRGADDGRGERETQNEDSGFMAFPSA